MIGLAGVFAAVLDWRSFPVVTLVISVIFLVAGLGGDSGAQWIDRGQDRLIDALGGALAGGRRLLAGTVGGIFKPSHPEWLGDGPLPSLDELGEDAAIVLECDEDLLEQPFERRPYHTALDLVITVYGHDRCDWFAFVLREATGWPVVEAASPRKPSAHRLNRDPQGRLVDVYGHVTLDDLRQRYGIDDLEIVDNGVIRRSFAPDRTFLPRIGSVMLHLPWEPFVSMRGALEGWVRYGRRDLIAADDPAAQRNGNRTEGEA
ncbi:MAG: hypothetical protein ACO3ZK_15880 [Rubrivivax sp.]